MGGQAWPQAERTGSPVGRGRRSGRYGSHIAVPADEADPATGAEGTVPPARDEQRLLGDEKLLGAFRNYYQANLFEIAELEDLRGALIAEAPLDQKRRVARIFDRWLTGRHGDEDIGKPDRELANSLGLPPKTDQRRGSERNPLNAFARVGKFFWQQVTRIR